MKSTTSRLAVTAAVVMTTSVILAGCASSGGGGGEGGGDPVKIGASLPLTGPLQAFGTSLEIGYQKAVDEVNEAGGLDIDGTKRQVELVVQDNASTGDTAGSQARDLILDDEVVALLGPATPPLSIPVSAAAEQAGIPALFTITPIEAWKGGNPDGWNWAWDVFFDEDQMTDTQFQAADLVETNKKVALFTDQEEDGIVMGGLWAEKAAEFGYDLVYQAQFPVGNTNFSSQVAEAKAADADIIISQVIPPDGIALLKEFKAQSYDPELFFLEKAGNTGGYPELTEGLADGTLAANWFAEGWGLDREAEFIDEFAGDLGGVNSDLGTIVYGYSIAKVLLDAITTAGSTDPEAINEAIGATDAVYPAGRIAFGDDNTAATIAVQTQWVGNDAIMVLDADGEAAADLVVPTPGLR
ncbi:ABC transporter substrate-binding protein [Herbiconiux sp. CPCC 203407]|uniref:ABC transporter substrate-binding protein n=1 Tax=Herbiconiux oxytropis TaxID=2970915 RepID=A0AA42BSY9_9MICO|nr:ABC transporter substrate-binding protein [Herbiconiux oxytropis]MCS5722930.1 ABC transporter substrate-binding protein [Herbiconiux oxytropis]MCS5725810.1 ABC transporter substrate-binding protein [Herbiconiux oxytropis]